MGPTPESATGTVVGWPGGAAGEAGSGADQVADVFVSYARSDSRFVDRLVENLVAAGRDVWVDVDDIPLTAEWMTEIRAGIDAAEAFCFVLSPDSATSPVCRKELAHAVARGKRIIPILYRDVEPTEVPAAVAALNWVRFGAGDDQQRALASLLGAMETDLEWVRSHTRLLRRASEWDDHERDRSYLLRGDDLAAAERWLAGGVDREPAPTQLQIGYLISSRAAASKARRLRWALVSIALVSLSAVTVVALAQRNEARGQRDQAEFERLTSQATDLADSDPSLALLLALEANRLRDTPPARSALLSVLQRQRDFLGFTPTSGPVWTSAMLDDDNVAYGTTTAEIGFSDLESGQAAAETLLLGSPADSAPVLVAHDPTRDRGDPVVVARGDTGQIWFVDPAGPTVGEPIDTGQQVLSVAARGQLDRVAVGLENGAVEIYDYSGGLTGTIPSPGGSGPEFESLPGSLPGGLDIDTGDPVALAFSPTGPQLAVERPDAAVEFWDPMSIRRVGSSEGLEPDPLSVELDAAAEVGFGALAYSPDGTQLLASVPFYSEETLLFIDTSTSRVEGTDVSSSETVSAMAYHPDGESAFIVDYSGDIRRVSSSGSVGPTLIESGLNGQGGIHVTSAGARVVVTDSVSPVLGEWRISGSTPLVTTFGAPGRRPVQIGPDSQSVLVIPLTSAARPEVWDPRTGRQVDEVPAVNALYGAEEVLFALFEDLTVGRYDLRSRRRLEPALRFELPTIEIDSSPTSGRLAASYRNGTVVIYDLRDPDPIQEITSRDNVLATATGISRDGTLIVIEPFGDDGAVYEIASGREVAGPVPSSYGQVLFTPDSESIILGLEHGGQLALRNLDETQEPTQEFPPLAAGPIDLELSADGTLLSVTDDAGHFRIFDVPSRTQLGDEFTLPQDGTGRVSPDGSFIVIEGADGLETWELRPERLQEIACRLAGRNLSQTEWDTFLPNSGEIRATCEQWPLGS